MTSRCSPTESDDGPQFDADTMEMLSANLPPNLFRARDPRLQRAWQETERTNQIAPVLKEELRLRILAKRMEKGEPDIDIASKYPKTYELTEEEKRKRERRKEQNRRAAKKCRDKRRMKSLSEAEHFDLLREQNSELTNAINFLNQKKEKLEQIYREHISCGNCLISPNSTSNQQTAQVFQETVEASETASTGTSRVQVPPARGDTGTRASTTAPRDNNTAGASSNAEDTVGVTDLPQGHYFLPLQESDSSKPSSFLESSDATKKQPCLLLLRVNPTGTCSPTTTEFILSDSDNEVPRQSFTVSDAKIPQPLQPQQELPQYFVQNPRNLPSSALAEQSDGSVAAKLEVSMGFINSQQTCFPFPAGVDVTLLDISNSISESTKLLMIDDDFLNDSQNHHSYQLTSDTAQHRDRHDSAGTLSAIPDTAVKSPDSSSRWISFFAESSSDNSGTHASSDTRASTSTSTISTSTIDPLDRTPRGDDHLDFIIKLLPQDQLMRVQDQSNEELCETKSLPFILSSPLTPSSPESPDLYRSSPSLLNISEDSAFLQLYTDTPSCNATFTGMPSPGRCSTPKSMTSPPLWRMSSTVSETSPVSPILTPPPSVSSAGNAAIPESPSVYQWGHA